MRTTIRMNDDLLREVKLAAARRGCTFTRFVEDALRSQLASADQARQVEAYRVVTFDSGVRPGVDLDSNADLLELMDSS
jgi:metal-responsive CopG/Arc/MetJ family transcriptional regulator